MYQMLSVKEGTSMNTKKLQTTIGDAPKSGAGGPKSPPSPGADFDTIPEAETTIGPGPNMDGFNDGRDM